MVADFFNNCKVLGAQLKALATKSEAVAATEAKLLKENAALRQQLNDAQTHVFALQPFHEDLTPEDINDAFKKVVDGVQAWTQNTCQKLPATAEQGNSYVRRMARADPRGIHKLQVLVREELDISVALSIPDTDEDILIAIMMRALNFNVFNHPQEALATTVTKKRDAVAISNWNAEALTALVSTPYFEREQKKQLMDVTAIISQLFGIFCPEEKFEEFHQDIVESCVIPAAQFQRKIACSPHQVEFDFNRYRELDQTRRISTSPEFFANFNRMRESKGHAIE
ncbi:uncharacterized protein J7T54_004823 [Emericellopsis cladophorae]|uniref:Uncharacterized protein n=1 Tax=Emericellopsis cladophorae TaxID=2686198 RepID=A0A9Q0BFR4_9HYPO|nr:uncharacterized protein J7T54_004823 [Emericellopsis cladophorae]KAI6784277.1 hypothetical protein J7T54_004823 [Emericellopsis cladophorae]